MKISNLTETATPSSMPDPNTAAPKFGRSDEMLESGVGTSTAGGIASVSKPMGKMRTRGQGSMFKGISTSSKYANSKKAGISEDSVNEDELSEEQLQAKKRREENFKKAKDRELGNKPTSRDIMTKEEFNGEYDDEAGMFKNNLQTIQRVSTHLEKAIADNENLPEWCQEKIGVAKAMVVTVMDYMISQHENGERPTVDEAGPGIPFRGVGGAFNRGDDERHDLDTPKPTAPQIWGLKINGKVWTKAGKSVTFTSKEAALKSRDSILKTRPDLEIGLVTRGGTTGPQSKTDDNFQAYLAQRKAGQQSVTESSQRVDSLVTDALKIMRGSEVSDAIQALKTVLGNREYNDRRGHYNFYVKQILDMYGQQGVAEESKGLWANIHAKRERIKQGSGEKMRKPGSDGAPTASALRKSAK